MATLRSWIPRRYRVATALLISALTLAACGADTGVAGSEPAGGETSVSASSDPSNPTTEPTKQAVEKVDVTLLPEEGQVDSIERVELTNGSVGAQCAEGYVPVPLAIEGRTTVDKTTVETVFTDRGIQIKAAGKLMSVESLVVNGTGYTPITEDVAQANDNVLYLKYKDWKTKSFDSLVFCTGGSGYNAPVI